MLNMRGWGTGIKLELSLEPGEQKNFYKLMETNDMFFFPLGEQSLESSQVGLKMGFSKSSMGGDKLEPFSSRS